MSNKDPIIIKTSTIKLNTYRNESPSRICMICECLEHTQSDIVSYEAWICDKCKIALRKIVERETRLHEQETKND